MNLQVIAGGSSEGRKWNAWNSKANCYFSLRINRGSFFPDAARAFSFDEADIKL